jgi:KaiC/GvpD/RAD55 family RecA-like ATPase
MKEIAQAGIQAGSAAITALSKLENKDELLLSYSLASLHTWYLANISGQEKEAKQLAAQCLSYSESANKLADQVGNPYLKAASFWSGTLSTLFFTENIESSLDYSKKMLEQASIVRDNYLQGIAYYLLSFVSDWMIPGEANPDKKKKRHEEILCYAREGVQRLQIVLQDAPIAETYLFYSENYSDLARDFAVHVPEKLACSKKAIETGEKGLEHAIRSGSLDATASTLHALSKALQYYSNLEPMKLEKPELLKTALGYRKEYANITQRFFGTNSWVMGVGLVYAGQIEAEIARTGKEGGDKSALLLSAIANMQEGVSYCKKWVESRAVPSLVAIVAGFEDDYAGMLYENYSVTAEKENLNKANEALDNAADDFKKVDLPSRVAESYWRIARNHDLVGQHDQASQNFEKAFAGYKAAAQKISQFSDFYLDYASYMKAWSEIEHAKIAHINENYAVATQHYEKTTNLLKQSKSWDYLSSNFYAWSLLEQAEDLSRKENCTESIAAFGKAIKFLSESERILRSEFVRIDRTDEQNLVKNLIDASRIRGEYGKGRIAIEEAKILNMQGNHTASSEKYECAAEAFQKIAQVDSEQVGKEARALVYLCQAWQKMNLAEARASPIMYEESAALFELANKYSTKESTSLLALGHSNFCKALEAGTEFEITRNSSMYEETMRYMDSASNYYLRAGFESASDYAKATQRLFDAYIYMDSAKREKDPGKEARYYTMAERVLQISAECYAKAGHTGKSTQVERLLKKVKEERELALSLNEVFQASSITSSTTSFSAIEPTEEKAVGLERFEHADVQAKIVQHETGLRVGENADLEVQIVNVGKEAVLLTKIDNILPAGFQLSSKPDCCSIEGTGLAVKAKQLEPLELNGIKFALRSFIKGPVEIKPRIVCVDQTGRQMIFSLEPVTFNFLEAALPGRVSTGYMNLDNLLLGGIPENYAVILTSPSIDERERLIRKFIQAGLTNGQTTFFITGEPGNVASLAQEFQTTLYLFVCNPRADAIIQNLPNVFKIKGVESLTDIDIALTKSFRMLDASRSGPRRACIDIVSDVLLQHHAVTTRKWLSGLIPDLRSKGFTTLAVINPQMHSQEEVQAILGLFEGEIKIYEKETEKGPEKILRIKKLYNQKYLEKELILTNEELQ